MGVRDRWLGAPGPAGSYEVEVQQTDRELAPVDHVLRAHIVVTDDRTTRGIGQLVTPCAGIAGTEDVGARTDDLPRVDDSSARISSVTRSASHSMTLPMSKEDSAEVAAPGNGSKNPLTGATVQLAVP